MTIYTSQDEAVPRDWRTRQPGFTLWVLIAIPRVLLNALFFAFYYIPSSLRQNPTWTYRQAVTTQLLKLTFRIVTEVGFTQTLSLDGGKLGDRWVILEPASVEAIYRGPFPSNGVKPQRIGATWYPEPPSRRSREKPDTLPISSLEDKSLVVLSFHSGSFLWVTGRPKDCGVTADLLNEKLGKGTRSLWPQYRLAGGKDDPTPWPGPVQDAITSYVHLVKDLGISPTRIVLAGDSSGGTMVMALLRYLHLLRDASETSTDNILAGLPLPKACLLFSPSVNYTINGDSRAMSEHRNARTDWCEARMMAWGVRSFAPPSQVRLDDPFLSPALHPFATPVPIFVQSCGAELLCDSIRGFADAMRGVAGNHVEYMEVPDVPHDMYIDGNYLGWGKQQEDIIIAAANFVSRLR